jgi:AcrR family transcriptional regulator
MDMPLPRFGNLDPEKRRHLIDVAIARFAEKGFDGASLNEILASAGFGKSSYYYYFADKEDLFATVIEEFWSRIEPELRFVSLEGLDATTFWPAIEKAFVTLAAIAARFPNMIALARDIRPLWLNPSPRLRPNVDRVLAWQKSLLELGRSLGTVRKDIDVDWLLSIAAAADQAVDERLLRLEKLTEADLREHARVVFDTFQRLVAPK